MLAVCVAALTRVDVAGEGSGPTDDGGLWLALAVSATVDDLCMWIGCTDVANLKRAVQNMALSRALIVQYEGDENGGWRGLVEDH